MDEQKGTDIATRTPDVIAGEIRVIKEQTRKILLVSAVEIVQRLKKYSRKKLRQLLRW